MAAIWTLIDPIPPKGVSMNSGIPKSVILGGLVLIAALLPQAQAQTAAVPCEPSAEVREALRNLPEATGTDGRAQRLQALRSLLERYPNDFFVHRNYQDTARYPTAKDQEAVITEYRALAQKHPNDPLYGYLAARALVGASTKEAIPQLEKLSAQVPFAGLSLVNIHQAPNFKDPSKARLHLEAFMKACPTTVGAFRFLRSLETSDFVKQNAERLRALLETRSDPESLYHYSTLWALEFRVRPPNEHEALRKQVAEDVKRLRAIDPGKNRSFYSMLQEGYKLLGDTENTKWVQDQIKAKFPQSAFFAVYEQWREQNPYPKSSDAPEKRKAYYEALGKGTAEWARQWPDEPYVWYTRISALREAEKPDLAEVEAAGESLLQAVAKNTGQFSFMSSIGGSSFALQVADLYSRKGVRADRLPELVQNGIQELDKPRRGLESDLYSRPDGDSENRDYNQWYAWTTIADVWLRAKEKDRAREAVQRLQTIVDKSKPKVDSKDPDKAASQQRTYISRQQTYWHKMGELAELESSKIDALTFYQNALLARPKKPDTGSESAKDELAEKARALWKEFGGSNEGWQAWFNRRDLFGQAAAELGGLNWTKKEKPLPEFELADMRGTKWRLANLKGKTTLIGMWATW